MFNFVLDYVERTILRSATGSVAEQQRAAIDSDLLLLQAPSRELSPGFQPQLSPVSWKGLRLELEGSWVSVFQSWHY